MTKQYKYKLDKSSKKFTCPNCNKKTLVRFVNVHSEGYSDTEDGRCDRESKCGYFKKPSNNSVVLVEKKHNTSFQKPSYHNLDVLRKYGNNYKQNNFITYLLKYFAPIDVKQAIRKYFIAT